MGLNIGFLIGGIGIFVFGIQQLEKALRSLMSRRFKLFLMRMTNKPVKAILGGTVVTAVLQSSSVVNFLVLAFAGSGVITLKNALAVVMGANLGTTVNSWIVATLGFRVDIEAFALPVVGVAGLVLFMFNNRRRVQTIAQFFLGFGLLFVGLAFMKDSVAGEEIQGAIERFRQFPPILFVGIGFIATTITQSSAATVAITLSLLYQQVVGLDDAMAIVIGSEVGTSVKLLIGALDRVPIKQRIATGNFLYNVLTTIVAFVCLYPAHRLITTGMHIQDPLIALATFQTGMNVMSIALCLPFLNPLSNLLGKFFTKEQQIASFVLTHHTSLEPEAGVEMLNREAGFFIQQCLVYNARNFHLSTRQLPVTDDFVHAPQAKAALAKPLSEHYALLKEQYGEIQSYYLRFKEVAMDQDDARATDIMIAAVRSAMHASKCMKDVHPDITEMEHAVEQHFVEYLQHMRKDVQHIYYQLHITHFLAQDKQLVSDTLMHILQEIQQQYTDNVQHIYHIASANQTDDMTIATLMNVNREIFTSHKAMLMSVKNYVLPYALATAFDDIPTYRP